MTKSKELKQYVEDLEVALAMRLDDLGTRLEGIERDIAIIKARLLQSRIDPKFVAARLGLTPAQSRVAVALAEGRTVDDIAETMGITKHTARYYFRQIHHRLNISRQVELVRLVLQLPHGVDARPD